MISNTALCILQELYVQAEEDRISKQNSSSLLYAFHMSQYRQKSSIQAKDWSLSSSYSSHMHAHLFVHNHLANRNAQKLHQYWSGKIGS